MKEFKLNKEKAINSLLYVCQSQGGSCDKYTLLKIIFFADSKHLFLYGRPITGDTMISMKYGPVPSFCYDLVKKDDRFPTNEENIVESQLPADLMVFSESDIECLNESIKENAPLPFYKLRNKSHTSAYEQTKEKLGIDKQMSYLVIAKEDGQLNDEMLKYISSRFDY